MQEHYSVGNILIFAVLVVVALYVDLHSHKKDEAISAKNATIWSIFWIALSLAFAVYVGVTHGKDQASLFMAGYLLEKSLSVDNLFVFMAIFSSFGIKDQYQHRILYFGIIGALILRMVFVAAGSSFILMFGKFALTCFGLFVLWSAWKMWQASREGEGEEIVDYTHHWSVNLVKRFIPVYPHKVGHDFFHKDNGSWKVTPFFLCLVCVEFADVMFAFDSVPAVIAVTQEPFLVYTSNIFAILGLRSMYFLLAVAKRYLCHLEKAVIAILVFIGLKMILDVVGIIHLTPTISLAIVATLLGSGILMSFCIPEPETKQE
jgi:tellurite resistance protein TerC